MNELDGVRKEIASLLPNKGAARAFVWDNLSGPIDRHVLELLEKDVGVLGSWKTRCRKDGKLAYHGWIYRQKKQGRWRYFYKNGKPRKECHYRGNQLHGKCVFWNLDGAYKIAFYRKGRRDGPEFGYSPDGDLRYRTDYRNGRLVGFKHVRELCDEGA